jgi:hypothetical protein
VEPVVQPHTTLCVYVKLLFAFSKTRKSRIKLETGLDRPFYSLCALDQTELSGLAACMISIMERHTA